MKRIISSISIFSLSLALLSLGACERYLEIEPPFTQDAENYFATPEDYELALLGAYDLIQGSFINIWIGEIASDNSIAGGESVFDTEGLHQIDAMNHNAVNNELRNVMRWNYTGVARCNFIMENRDNINFEGKARILAETRFLRAYYYFQLVKYFGDMPLVIDRRLGAEEVTKIDRNPRSEVYSQIESDLRAAVEGLEWSYSTKGRVNKGAALALLGKVYLYQAKFPQAQEALDRVINEGSYSLLSDYGSLFLVANEGHSESVFDIEYSGLQGGGYDCLICLEGNPAPGFHGIRQYDGPIYGDGNSYNLPTDELYQSFDANDPRRDWTVLDIDAFIAAQPDPGSIKYAQGGGGHTGYFQNKYIKRSSELGLPDNDLTSPLNYTVIRYADVLLMAAEAHAQNGDEGTALNLLNQVRQRVGLSDRSSSGPALLEDIYQERRFELSGEGQRFFDLVRTGRAAERITGFQTGKHELFPIPQVEIDLAGGRWAQNPGY